MNSKSKSYNTYTKEFKLEALRMTNESDRHASEIVMKLWEVGSEHSFC